MRGSVVLIALGLCLTSAYSQAECISKDGEPVNAGFLECARDGNRYLGEIDRTLVRFLLGTWSTNCSAMKSKVVYRFQDQQFISQIYDLDEKDNTLKSPVFLEIVGLRESGGLVYLAGKTHLTTVLPSVASSSEVSSDVLVTYKAIDKNTRAVEEGYIVRNGKIEQDIKGGVFVKNGEKMVYARCPEEPHH